MMNYGFTGLDGNIAVEYADLFGAATSGYAPVRSLR